MEIEPVEMRVIFKRPTAEAGDGGRQLVVGGKPALRSMTQQLYYFRDKCVLGH